MRSLFQIRNVLTYIKKFALLFNLLKNNFRIINTFKKDNPLILSDLSFESRATQKKSLLQMKNIWITHDLYHSILIQLEFVFVWFVQWNAIGNAQKLSKPYLRFVPISVASCVCGLCAAYAFWMPVKKHASMVHPNHKSKQEKEEERKKRR